MIVYHPLHTNGLHHLAIAPAAIDPSCSREDWFEGIGDERHPRTLRVSFWEGRANVDDGLGRFLIHNEYARASQPLFRAA